MTTRERIVSKAIETFNQQGYHHPTLADIAHICDMSRGNLAYHFKEKKAILDEVSMLLLKDINEIQKERKGYPAFSNLSLDISTYNRLQLHYPFIFRDTSVLEYGSIREVMSSWSQKCIHQNMKSFAFAIEVGTMKPEPYEGLYYHLAVNTWLICYYWSSQKTVRQISDDDDAEKMVWSTIIPHFTVKGIKAFVSYYGSNYLAQLGKPFSTVMKPELIF